MHLVQDVLFLVGLGILGECFASSGRILSPPDLYEYHENEAILFAEVLLDGDTIDHDVTVCWTLLNRHINETVEGCWPYQQSKGWNGTTVTLPNRGAYDLTLSLFHVSEDHNEMKGFVLSQQTSLFKYAIHPKCREAIRARDFTQDQFYETLQMGDGGSENEADSWVAFEFAPLCYDFWPDSRADDFLAKSLLVTASSRGMFGVDYSMQQFGHGDRMMLDWVLDKHRLSFLDNPNIVELGTFGGVTALYLGMAAGLRGGRLDTFDIVDVRSPPVKSNWLANMHFHLGNANAIVEDVSVEKNGDASATEGSAATAAELIRQCSLVLVDHADRLRFAKNVAAPNLRPGAVIVVHDFPPEGTTVAQWDEELGKLGMARRYISVQNAFQSRLATFTHADLPGRR